MSKMAFNIFVNYLIDKAMLFVYSKQLFVDGQFLYLI